jgi:hypothetical protein
MSTKRSDSKKKKTQAHKSKERTRSEREQFETFLKVLLQGERAGLVRGILESAATSLKKTASQNAQAQSLLARRRAIVSYFLTLLRDFDAITKAEIIQELIVDLREGARQSEIERSPNSMTVFKYDDHAAWGILLTMASIGSLLW